jgi:hypothetical protein
MSNRAFGATTSSIQSGPWSSPATWSSGAVPHDSDDVIIASGYSVFLDTASAALRSLRIDGKLATDTHFLYLIGNRTAQDTAVIVLGSLDAGAGWVVTLDSLALRPIVHLAAGSLFRTKASIPMATHSVFDSARSPIFACDTNSTFEYYSDNLDLIDVSYLANNLVGHAYGNLSLTKMVASFLSNPVTILGLLRIGRGSSVIASARKPYVVGYTPQVIILDGDVVNENGGESGSTGAGIRGCGMQSLGTDRWIFERSSTGRKDTCHWSGPSQLGTVIVRKNTVLSVRFFSDTACDSLDILTGLVEEEKPCGGHLIGRVFSEFPRILDASNPVDSFYGLGITIRSGTNPYLGRTKVVRTSGYAPPGIIAPNQMTDRLPAQRYYNITTGAGPQRGDTNEIAIQLHCDELNGADPATFSFWRSRVREGAWAASGRRRYDSQGLVFTWDTTTLGFPNDSGSFYWTLSSGYMDVALPAGLESFTVQPEESSVKIEWQSGEEINMAGYELGRSERGNSTVTASYSSNPSLVSHSKYGSSYSYSDPISVLDSVRYDLYSISEDGVRTWLASRIAFALSPLPQTTSDCSISFNKGELSISLNTSKEPSGILRILDAVGRTVLERRFEGTLVFQPTFASGAYFAIVEYGENRCARKFSIKNH